MTKSKILLSVFIGLMAFMISTNEIKAQSARPVKPHVNLAYLEMCDGKGHVYINIPTKSYPEGTIVNLIPTWSSTNYTMQKTDNGFEVELFNVPVPENNIVLQINAGDGSRTQFSDTYIHSKPSNELLVVTPHLDKLIADHQSKQKATPISTYFCGKKISTVELLAFFQKFLKLSKEETCALLLKYNYMTEMEALKQISFLDRAKLCNMFAEYLKGGTGNGSGCLCNVIATNRASYFLDDDSNSDDNQYGCTDGTPKKDCENLELFVDDDDLIVSQGRLGASKAVTLALQYDGCDDSPDPFIFRTKAAGAAIAFHSVCYDPITLSGNLTNCTGCIKTIDLEYSYQSASRIAATASNNLFCGAETIELTGEDWATLVVTNGSATIVEEANSQKHNIKCNVDSPKLQNTITNTSNIINDISSVVSGTLSVTAISEAAVKIVDFLETNVFVAPCNGVKIEHYPLIGGTKSYELEPGGYFQAVILSGATVAGIAVNNAKGFIKLNSDFHMAAAVRTKVDETGIIPTYCTCEKIGGYVLASLIGEPAPTGCSFRNEEPVFNLSSVFEYDGRSTQMLQNLAGVFLGLHGPWDPKWSNNGGCCTTVDLNCMAECAYITEPCPTSNPKPRTQNPDQANIVIYPNPATQDITIKSLNGVTIRRIKVLDIAGKTWLKKDNLNSEIEKLNIENQSNGIFFISILDTHGNSQVKKIVKQ